VKKLLALSLAFLLMGAASWGLLTFFLVDNFEDQSFSKWFQFDNVELSLYEIPKSEKKDLVLESCGDYALQIKGSASDWYVGGVGTDFNLDASSYSRLQFDMYGSSPGGKVKIELIEDDNGNSKIEQDSSRNWELTADDKWEVEVPILKEGFTRYSIPFSAFTDGNPGVGDSIFNPDQENGSGGILRVQLIFIAAKQKGDVDVKIDNVIFTY